ncbi:RagB/SusD family nutrient uptake outer membrane protein [Sphingobacterium sp. SGG-5]|uniref:RagB/SusD family nutrient uptake outer membrane protein n=1 Tax=Sphingobacterium sp. SGG-5 TaxID=2710881 RepID=UPI0013EA8D9A|nr:RagB/SusD family nutrient uptake outer membrane protein [Sphingobacterium sp. SGG-5]NGM61330.1 RagB/SusD family nutrient uptake outer membrane protein [Sphingobacterium sp. SGG-5]
MNTQKITRYGLFALLLLSFSGCKKFLNVMPVGQTTIPVLFSDMDGIRAAIPGAYAKTYDYYSSHFYIYPELAGDLLNPDLSLINEGQINIYNFSSIPDQEAAPSAKIWSDILAALANVNNALFYIPSLKEKFPANRNELDIYKAELLFLRALGHFDLCRAYAQPYTYTAGATHLGVPILSQTPSPDDNVSRQSVGKVYEFILNDLKEAERIYNSTPIWRSAKQRPYFVSKEAVQALLSRVYLYMEDWDQTIYYAGEVIKELPLAQGDAYTDMFFNLTGPETETIFRLNGEDKGSSIFGFYNFRVSAETVGYPSGTPANKLLNSYEDEDDIRKTNLLLKIDVGPGFYFVTRKFDAVQTSTEKGKQHVNPLILRTSEMYLNRAEAYIGKKQPEQAAADIKAIQARALGTTSSGITLPESDLNAMTNIVYQERLRELALEGHRLFDITRRKQNLVRDATTTSTVQELTYPSDYFILPIPQRELDANPNMEPNPTVNN